VIIEAGYWHLLLAIALGAVVGWERFIDHKPAGLRTHTLVALGAAGVMVAARGIMGDDPAADREMSRVVQGVITGIGFLGAGSILQSGGSVRGLTTAASIWIVAAIGVAAGAGQVGYAVALTIGTWIVLRGFRSVERAWLKRHPRKPAPVAIAPKAREQFDRD
jgi:putative Mg2+ transporter-C (MgtC) family protein